MPRNSTALGRLLNAAIAFANDVENPSTGNAKAAYQAAVDRFRRAQWRYERDKPKARNRVSEHGAMHTLPEPCPPRATALGRGEEYSPADSEAAPLRR